jgi:Mg-chelatase subunit ChlD
MALRFNAWAAALGLLAIGSAGPFTGCSAGDGEGSTAQGGASSGGASGGGAAGSSGASGNAGSSATGGAGGTINFDAAGGASGDGGFDPDSSCAGEVHQGEQIPLDLFIMLDISGSMDQATAAGGTKWDATKQALIAFLQDGQSDGLGVGIQYFPIKAAGAPDSCTNDGQCGAHGPCFLKLCDNSTTVIPCSTNAECSGGNCVPFGVCANAVPQTLCLPPGGWCTLLSDPCLTVGSSTCMNADCDVSVYSSPAVPIAALPGNASALTASINGQITDGATPTAAALTGAINYAKDFATQNAGHTVVVVFATDGLPTECKPGDIPGISQIAAGAYGGTPSIRTFVVGVFAPSETQAPANLNAIAAAGGTQTAFIIDTSQNVTQQLIDAFNAIRGSVLQCEFEIPLPLDAGTLDFNKVNVKVSAGGTDNILYYVGDASKCDPAAGGWYYDVDPATGGTPTKIIVCPSTCDAFKATLDASVDIQLGCESIPIPPR